MTLTLGLALGLACGLPAAADDTYLVGRARADITLRVVGVRLMGFARPDQIAAGLHQRQDARAFVVAADGIHFPPPLD